MNERDLTRHLMAYSATIEPEADPARLQRGMERLDRVHRVRVAGAAGSILAITVFGLMTFGGAEHSAPEVDVRGELPDSSSDGPQLSADRLSFPTPGDDGEPDTSHDPVGPEVDADPTSEPDPPIHLQATTTTAPTTTLAVTLPVVTTTAPPTTTVAPTTTAAPPTTTVASTTTTAPPAPTTTVVATSFTASSRYGSCAEDPPYDEYSGTAAPDATITISSPYSATVQLTADSSGDWYRRVEFPDSPVGTPFEVTVTDGTSTIRFDFVRTA